MHFDLENWVPLVLILFALLSFIPNRFSPRPTAWEWLQMQQKLDAILAHQKISYDPFANASADLIEAVRSGEQIKAIRLCRAQMGLKEAKDYVIGLSQRLEAETVRDTSPKQ